MDSVRDIEEEWPAAAGAQWRLRSLPLDLVYALASRIAVRPPSINIKDVPRSGAGVRIIDGGCAWSWSIPPCRLVDDDGTKDLRLQKEAGRRRPLLERSTGPARPR